MTNSFNNENRDAIIAHLKMAIEAVAQVHGVVIEIDSHSFNTSFGSVKLNVATKTANAWQEAAKKQTFTTEKGEIIVGKTRFRHNDTLYTVVDYKPSRRKYPFVGVGPQGGRWKFTREAIVKGMI